MKVKMHGTMESRMDNFIKDFAKALDEVDWTRKKAPTEREKFMEPPWETPKRDWGEAEEEEEEEEELKTLYRSGFVIDKHFVDKLLGIPDRCRWCDKTHEPAAYEKPSVICIANLKEQIEEKNKKGVYKGRGLSPIR